MTARWDGQHLARVRIVTHEHVTELQVLDRNDLAVEPQEVRTRSKAAVILRHMMSQHSGHSLLEAHLAAEGTQSIDDGTGQRGIGCLVSCNPRVLQGLLSR